MSYWRWVLPAKKVKFGSKPADKPASVDQWVETREVSSSSPVKMKRLTLDIPEPLHRAIKMKAVEQGVAMAELLRELLEEHYGK